MTVLILIPGLLILLNITIDFLIYLKQKSLDFRLIVSFIVEFVLLIMMVVYIIVINNKPIILEY